MFNEPSNSSSDVPEQDSHNPLYRSGYGLSFLFGGIPKSAWKEREVQGAPGAFLATDGNRRVWVKPPSAAPALLDQAAKHMRDRAATYDKPEGERSMGKTVQAFNAITGRDLAEHEGWLLMALLKMVRSETSKEPHQDSVEDLIAYGALYGEARLGGK